MVADNDFLLTIDGLTKSYDGSFAVKELSFKVKSGEIFGLLGPNGAGKTTSLECILGTRRPESGKVEIFGTPREKTGPEIFERIGVQFQDSHFPDLIKVDELCIMSSALYRKSGDWMHLLELFQIEAKRRARVSELSGGERQKLTVVLALINNPELVFLDELTTGLDPGARRDVWKYLLDLKERGLTILLTSHFMDEVSYLCDRLMIISGGREVVQGTPTEVIAKSGTSTMEDAYLFFTGAKGEASEKAVYTV